jgi:uncharacterized repeat protein (TIGR01451 family)
VSGPTSASLGDQIAVKTTVKNQGSGDSGGFYTSIYLSADPIIDTKDVAVSTFYVSPLVSGAQQAYTVKPVIPGTVAPGMYYIGAIADTGNRVGESNKNNNALAGNQISIVSKVDLVMTSVSGPTSASPGQQVTFTGTVKNQGSASAGQFYVTVYLSTDSNITIDDVGMGSGFILGLAAGTQQTLTINSTIPTNLLPGLYYIGAIADSRNNVAESNKNNNSLAGNQMTISLPDLVLTSVSGPASAAPGQQIGVVATVKNQGSGSSGGFYVSGYLSTDPVITPWDDAFQTGDLEIGAVYVAGLAASAQQTLTINCTVPSTLTGTFYLGAIADSRNNVKESNESNNSLAGGQITIAK